MKRGYRLNAKEWRWVVANAKLYRTRAHMLAATDLLSMNERQDLAELSAKLIETCFVKPKDRPGLLRMLLIARQECDLGNRTSRKASLFIDAFLARLSQFDWEALDTPDESTYHPTRLAHEANVRHTLVRES